MDNNQSSDSRADGITSDMSEAEVEYKILAAGKTAPRITPELIDNLIASKFFFRCHHAIQGTFHHAEYENLNEADPEKLSTLTFCVLVLKNGFSVIGESNCVSPENFDFAIGRDIAYKNAREKIWVLEGYRLTNDMWLSNSALSATPKEN